MLSGAGLSAASGIPTFRGADGLWEGHRIDQVATPVAWKRDPTLVRRFYDLRRVAAAKAEPNAAHAALTRLQRQWGPERVVLVTQNVDGLLTRAGAPSVIEMHGSLHRLRCEAREDHPRVAVSGPQDPEGECGLCLAPLRPDIVWFGETPHALGRISEAVAACTWFLSVGTSGVVYPAAGYVEQAAWSGATCLEINPEPAGGPFNYVLRGGAETLLPSLVDHWLAGTP